MVCDKDGVRKSLERDTLKIKQTPLSDILEPRLWGLGSFSLKKPKVYQFVNGDHARTPKCTEG